MRELDSLDDQVLMETPGYKKDEEPSDNLMDLFRRYDEEETERTLVKLNPIWVRHGSNYGKIVGWNTRNRTCSVLFRGQETPEDIPVDDLYPVKGVHRFNAAKKGL
jgi:hypothetical protein